MKIGTIGLWHLGAVYSTCLAELGHEVFAYDENKNAVLRLASLTLPVEEPGLRDLMEKNTRDGRLKFVYDPEKLKECEVIWFTLDTTLDKDGRPDVPSFLKVAEKVMPYLRDKVLIVVSSQLPVGTGAIFRQEIRRIRPDLSFGYAYQPENLQLGTALESFLKPSRIVMGSDSEAAYKTLEEVFLPLKVPLLKMSVASAEMTKHALNAFLATSLSFIYDIADLCERYGADVIEVSNALKKDPRVGERAYLDASIGFSGGTLARDLLALMDKAKEGGVEIPVVEGAFEKNKERWRMVLNFLEKEAGNLKEIKVGVLGITYKPGTSSLRHSLSPALIRSLQSTAKEVHIHDPLAKEEEVNAECGGALLHRDPYEMLKGCNAVVLMVAHPEYKDLKFETVAALMEKPKIFFDAKNFLGQRAAEAKQAGLRYHGVGRG